MVYENLIGREFPEISRGFMGYGRRVIGTALQYMGVPYVYGGSSPSGFDCSGFVQFVYAQAGISLPRTADIQYEVGTPIDKSDLQAGDLVFFAGDYVNVSHVGIYLQDGEFIHASTTQGIAIDSLYRDYRVEHYVGARRI
jgi:cell wall-associated NlpC family hydrolase